MGYGNQIAFALILSIPVACITWTITQEELFGEMRSTLTHYQSHHGNSWWRKKLAYVPTCAYCFSHYVAGMLIVLLKFKMLADDWRGYLVSLFTLVLIANVYMTGYQLLRVRLRWMKSLADHAEQPAITSPAQAVSRPAGVSSVPLGRTAQSTHRGGRHTLSERRV